jgi:hypothetical protein
MNPPILPDMTPMYWLKEEKVAPVRAVCTRPPIWSKAPRAEGAEKPRSVVMTPAMSPVATGAILSRADATVYWLEVAVTSGKPVEFLSRVK